MGGSMTAFGELVRSTRTELLEYIRSSWNEIRPLYQAWRFLSQRWDEHLRSKRLYRLAIIYIVFLAGEILSLWVLSTARDANLPMRAAQSVLDFTILSLHYVSGAMIAFAAIIIIRLGVRSTVVYFSGLIKWSILLLFIVSQYQYEWITAVARAITRLVPAESHAEAAWAINNSVVASAIALWPVITLLGISVVSMMVRVQVVARHVDVAAVKADKEVLKWGSDEPIPAFHEIARDLVQNVRRGWRRRA